MCLLHKKVVSMVSTDATLLNSELKLSYNLEVYKETIIACSEKKE